MTCRTLSDVEAAYWAALIDGEGTIYYHRPSGQTSVAIGMSERDLMFEFLELFGGEAKIYLTTPERQNDQRSQVLHAKKAVWRVNLTKNEDKLTFLQQICPFLKIQYKKSAAQHFILEHSAE